MIFVDSNIPMYLVGAAHPHKDEAQRLLAKSIADRVPLVTDAEDYHQDYAARNPDQLYIVYVAQPKVEKLRENFADRLKQR